MFSQQIIDTFWNALMVTGKGMTGIFVFMGLFYLIIKLIDKLFPQSLEEKKES